MAEVNAFRRELTTKDFRISALSKRCNTYSGIHVHYIIGLRLPRKSVLFHNRLTQSPFSKVPNPEKDKHFPDIHVLVYALRLLRRSVLFCGRLTYRPEKDKHCLSHKRIIYIINIYLSIYQLI